MLSLRVPTHLLSSIICSLCYISYKLQHGIGFSLLNAKVVDFLPTHVSGMSYLPHHGSINSCLKVSHFCFKTG